MNQRNLEPKIPADLGKALSASPKAKEKWDGLTHIARRDFISWVTSAKQEETRARRVGRVSDMLIKGKRRPCCYSIVPMNLYRALGTNQRAKATWRELTSDEKRDLIDQLGSDKGKEARKQDIEKAIELLAKGFKK